MNTEHTKDLAFAIWDLQDRLSGSPAKGGGNLWDQVVQHCKDGAVDHKFVKPVEEHIRRYLASISEASKRQIWSETETGQVNGGDASYFDIGTIEMDLESELLAEMLEHAFRQAAEMRSKTKRVRKGRSTRGQ